MYNKREISYKREYNNMVYWKQFISYGAASNV